MDADGDLQEIEVSLGGTGSAAAQVVQKGTQSATFTSIPDDRTEYTITVVAVDASGNRSAAATETVVADKTGPGAVTNVQASSGETTVTLTWTNPSPVHNDFTETVVTCSDTSVAVAKASDSSVTVTGLSSGTAYSFTFTTRDDLGNSDSSVHSFTWQKLTLNSIIGSGFTKDGQAVGGASGTTLELYWLKDAVVQETVYNAYKPVADGNTFSWWKDTSTGNQQAGSITMSADVTLIANYSAVRADNAVAYINGLGTGEHTVKITGTISSIYSIRDALRDEAKKITLDLTETELSKLVQQAFLNATALVEVKLPDSLSSFISECFRGCSNLQSVNIPDGITELPSNLFFGCSSLTSITIPSTVKTIGGDTFWGCSSLTSITIPSAVTKISSDAFFECSNLQKVSVEATEPPTIDSSSTTFPFFYKCDNLTEINVPQDKVADYKAASGWSDCVGIIVGQ